MTGPEAPDLIWAGPDEDDGWRWPVLSKFPMQGYSPGALVSYTRTDLADAAHRAGYELARANAAQVGWMLETYDVAMGMRK